MYNHTNSIYSYVAVNVYLYIYALHGFFLHTVCLLKMRVTAVKQDFWIRVHYTDRNALSVEETGGHEQ